MKKRLYRALIAGLCIQLVSSHAVCQKKDNPPVQTIIHRIDSLLKIGSYADLIEYSDTALQPYKDSLTQDQLLRIHFNRIDAFIGLEKYDSIERELNEKKNSPS